MDPGERNVETHRQRCQACGSTTLHNILVREPGNPQAVFVQCADCQELVARYQLSDYYHHGKGIDSWLRSLGSGSHESGRDFMGEFERVRSKAHADFKTILAAESEGEENSTT